MTNDKTPTYKSNATKGSSILDPQEYKRDCVVQLWIDARILSGLVDWLESHDNYPRTLSEVVRNPLEILVEHLQQTEELKLTDDTAEARTRLQKRFRVNLNPRGKGKKNALHNEILSHRRHRPLDNRAVDALARYNQLYGNKTDDKLNIEELEELDADITTE